MSSNGCVGLNTFPMTARAGDTITIGIGLGYIHGGETDKMKKVNTQVIISDGGSVNYQLTNVDGGNGFVRAVFNLFPDPRSNVSNYNSWLTTPTIEGQPFETVVAVDLPPNIPNGAYTVEVVATDGAAGTLQPFITNLQIVGQGGSSNNFQDEFGLSWSLGELVNCPYGQVRFTPSATPVGAVELAISFDETKVNAADIRVVQPRINMDGQRTFFWQAQAGGTVYVYILAPQGVTDTGVLKFDIVHPKGTLYPNFSSLSTKVFDVNGNVIPGVGIEIASGGIFP